MSMLNQAHVEAICTGTYLEDYLDCLDALPDDLQRILTQIREIDLKIYELEKDHTTFEDLLSTLKDGHLDSRCITQLHRMLLKMQEFEDEKIQLSASLMDIIETRSKQLELDRENLDPVTNLINEPSAPKTLNVPAKRNNSVDCKAPSLNTVTTTVNGTSVPEPPKESQKQSDQKNTGTTTKKRKQRASEPATPTAEKTVTTNGSKSNQNTQPSNGTTANVNPGGSTPSREKDEISAKKQSVQVQPDEQLSKKETKNNIKRKRRSKVTAQTRNNRESKEPSIEPEEPTYCLCDQISYGEMIGCDNDNCPIEWFHFNCVGLTSKPKGKWYCPKCRGDKPTVMKKCDKK